MFLLFSNGVIFTQPCHFQEVFGRYLWNGPSTVKIEKSHFLNSYSEQLSPWTLTLIPPLGPSGTCLCQHWEGEQEPRWGWTTPGLAPERLQAWKACSTFMKRRRALSNAKKNHFNTIQIAWENLCPLAVLEIQVWKYYYLCQSSGIRGLNLGIKIQQITCILVDTFKPTTWSFRIYLRSFPPVEVMTFI